MLGFRPAEMIFMIIPLLMGLVGLAILGAVVYFAVRLAIRHERDSK